MCIRDSHIADDLAAGYMLPRQYRHGGKVSIDGEHVVTVIENYLAAIAGAHRGSGHLPICGGAHRRPIGSVNVDAGVERAFSVDGILALAKARSCLLYTSRCV